MSPSKNNISNKIEEAEDDNVINAVIRHHIEETSSFTSVSSSSSTSSKGNDDNNGISKPANKPLRKLSTFSKKYDVNGDGELDAAELAMRDMDKSGRGFLTNDKVYNLMKDQLDTQKELFRFKKVVIGLIILVALLALSNLGTSFAAVHLAKDISTSEDEELVSSRSKQILGTQTASDSFQIERATQEADGRRRLCKKNEDGEYNCETSSYLTISEDDAELMIRKCQRGHTVNLSRTWPNGDVTTTNICPSFTGEFRRNDIVTLVGPKGGTINIESMGDFYKLEGDEFQQGEGKICEGDADCEDGLVCEKDEYLVSECQARCRRLRFGPSKLGPCLDSCDHSVCRSP